MEPIERLEHYRKIQKIGFKDFEKSIGFSTNAFRTALTRKSGLSTTTVQQLIENYPELRLIWVFTGRGSIISSSDEQEVEKVNAFGEPDLLQMYDLIDKVIKEKNDSEVVHLKRELVRLYSLYTGLKSELYEIKKISDQIS
ncbi:MAG: hypothetical protein WBA74_06235 [Cyclobacteriaceae bacterium]